MIFEKNAALPFAPARAVIINCNTRIVTTLALLSALRYAKIPILLIDCASTDGSWDWFCQLSEQHRFDLVKMPLRPHGETLDTIFNENAADKIVLIDSDLEILSPSIVDDVLAAAAQETNYGAGFLHRSEWINGGHLPLSASGRYMDRMWIPFTCLKVKPVREALSVGESFMHSRDYFEFPWSLMISKILYARHRVPLLKKIELKFLQRFRHAANAGKDAPAFSPAFNEYDTGARLHAFLCNEKQYQFYDFGMGHCAASVKHYHGVTRGVLSPGRDNATPINTILDEVIARLHDEYGIRI